LNFTGLGFFNLTARVDAGNASSIMHVELFDSFFTKVASTIFQASNFTSSFTTQSKAISYTGLGNVADVTYFRIDGDGIASDSFRYSYENLAAATTAVPEPSTYALGAGILLGLCIARRELRKRRAA
jgi:hypothetical protein